MTILSFLCVEFELELGISREKGHRTEDTEVLGLGLVMVHRLAEAARNRLWCR
jgi:hypothetical protein